MKKEKDTVLIAICILFSVFLCGMFVGRATSRYPVDLTAGDINNSATISNIQDLYIDNKMNINIATVEDLSLIPSLGEEIAQKIIDYRIEHGGFRSLADLRNVDGLGSDRILQLIDYITVGGTYEDIGR